MECLSYHLAWQYPLGRSTNESVAHFAAAYDDAGATQSQYFDPTRKALISRLELGFVETLSIVGRRMVDVGAGVGIFASAAAGSGWEVTAVDPALNPTDLAGTAIRSIAGTLADLPAGERFDVVTLWDVVEHATDPVALIREARERSAPGGFLIIETGNYKCASRIDAGNDHWIYQLDHRWYFAPESLEGLLRKLRAIDLTFSQRVLRPAWKGRVDYAGPRLRDFIRFAVRHPLQIGQQWRNFRLLQQARTWRMAGLAIFCVAARFP